MKRQAGLIACGAAVLSLAGCSWLPNSYSSCDEVQPYQSASEVEPLRVPAGADQPDTRNALKIPEVTAPELPLESGTCLDHPPPYRPPGQQAPAAGPS